VLLPKRRFLFFEVSKKLGIIAFLRFLIIGILYEVGIITIETALKGVFSSLKGLSIEELFQLYRQVPLMPGAKEVIGELRERGFRIALISSGLPKILVEDLASKLGADYASGIELSLDNEYLTGKIGGKVIQKNGKAEALQEIINESKLDLDCAVVADDRNNLSLFKLCKLSIGFNPDSWLSYKSDHVVKEDLLKIVSIFDQVDERNQSSNITLRELIHISGIMVPIVCKYLFDDHTVAIIILIGALVFMVSELLRIFGIEIPILTTITLRSVTKYETQEYATAPIFYAFGIVFSLLLFPPPVNYTSIAVLALGDSFASIFGRKFGKNVLPFNKGKRIEGSFFGWIFAFLGSLIFVDPLKALLAASVGILAESLPSPINDNITIPIVSGVTLTIFAMFYGT
jgi:phosphoserine phosphatase